jgi:hypothetical protein
VAIRGQKLVSQTHESVALRAYILFNFQPDLGSLQPDKALKTCEPLSCRPPTYSWVTVSTTQGFVFTSP